jgi:hypothetical protein
MISRMISILASILLITTVTACSNSSSSNQTEEDNWGDGFVEVMTENVRDAWKSSFADPSFAEKLEYIVQTNADDLHSLSNVPGYQEALNRFIMLLSSPLDGLYSGKLQLDDKFDQQLAKINADWKLAQQEAAAQ